MSSEYEQHRQIQIYKQGGDQANSSNTYYQREVWPQIKIIFLSPAGFSLT